ncbi:RNA recognition motif-containing protein [Mortierella sp. AD032]|nr:RNA recognition motif-containing protein [Mortierella sp. AD032]
MSDTPAPVVAETAAATTTTATGEENTSKSTLFVRGLPYDATSAQLEAFFSEVGPVRSCFVVLDRSAEQIAAESPSGEVNKAGIAAAAATAAKSTPKNKGFGFVQFVLPEDADKAITELRATKFLKQRPLIMEKAVKKSHDGEEKPKKEFKPKPKTDKPKTDKPKQAKKEETEEPKEKNYSFQTVVLKGLGKDITKKHIYKKVRKAGEVKEVIFPVITKAPEAAEGEEKGEDQVEEGTAHIIYSTAALAAQAVQALDGHIFKACALHAALLASPSVYKRCRLIVRNLPWKIREIELRALFTKFGTVHEVNLPRKYDGGPLRGFGFVQMENLEATEKAVAALNGTEHHGRTIAVDWALAKDRFEEAEAKAQDGTSAAAEEEQDVEMEDATEENEDEEEEEEGDEDEDEEEGSDDDNEELDLDHLQGSDDEEAEDSDEEMDAEEEDAAALAALDIEEKEEKAESKMVLPEPSEGTTLFIRNLDFEATKDDLFELFRHWGKLRYCRVTMDHDTGRSRGTGFVCYFNKGAADNVMAEAQKVAAIVNPIQAENDKKKKNNFVKHTVLQPDLPEELALKFTLNGRVLNVVRAVDKTSAVSLLQAGQQKREREDRRNLYLMREGVIFPDSPAAKSILPGELSKRQASFSARRALLARNPSLYISKTRLSIRNLPLKMEEKDLRKLGVQAIQKFKNEVKETKRAHLSPEEIADGWDKRVFVKQAKIVRSKDRVDGDTKQLRSKGYGFLEYSTHAHALAGLRWLNNNPSLFGEKKCLIVEFSVENVMVNKQRDERETRRAGRSERDGKRKREGEDDGEGDNYNHHQGEDDQERKRPRRSIHEGGGGRDRGESRGGFRGGRGGGDRGGSRGGFRGGRGGSSDRGGSRGGFGGGDRGGRGGFRGGRGGSSDRGGSRGGFGGGDRGGSRGGFGGGFRGGRGGSSDRGGSRGGFRGGRGGGGDRGGRGGFRGRGRGRD